MVGPSKTARGGLTHLLVAVDKFTKWIEVKPIKNLNGPTAVTFIADITTRYGIPHRIITENGTNFAKGALARFCATQGIRLDLASVAHPQSNDQVERANGLILSGIKPRLVEPLEHSAGCWLDELPAFLQQVDVVFSCFLGLRLRVHGYPRRVELDVGWDDSLGTIYKEERSEAEGTKERRLRQGVGTTMERQPPSKIL